MDANEKLDCSGCNGHCCKFLIFGVNLDNHSPEEISNKLLYFKEHGCQVKHHACLQWIVTVPSQCQHLTPFGCAIYNDRPEICRKYDCRNEPLLPRGGKYNP
jgi:Fe-S-cluster containining protein